MVQVATSGLLNDINHKVSQSHRRIRRQSHQRPRSIRGLWCFVVVAIAGNLAVIGWIVRHAFHMKSTSSTSSLQQRQHAAMATSLRSPPVASAVAAGFSSMAAFTIMLIQRQSMIDSARPEIVLKDWTRETKNIGEKKYDIVSFKKVLNAGKGLSLIPI